MGFLGLNFGKKRRVSKRRVSKRRVSKHSKPPSKLLRICKKYRVKATKKVGGKKVYKSVTMLKKLCLRKAKALRKKLVKMHKKMSKMSKHKKMPKRKAGVRRRKHMVKRRDMMFGSNCKDPMAGAMMFGNMTNQNFVDDKGNMVRGAMFGKRRRLSPMYRRDMVFGVNHENKMAGAMFGKRGRVAARRPAHTRKAAMKAFRSFYKRHCAGHRAMGFGNGGNPMLSASMGYEFCPNGSGGVLGANSTGLFPSPCTAPSSSGYGLRRRRRATAIGNTESRRKARADKMKKDSKYFMKGHKEYPGYAIGAPKRRRRCVAVGARRRTAAGVISRRRAFGEEAAKKKRRRRRAEFGGGLADFVKGVLTGGTSNANKVKYK